MEKRRIIDEFKEFISRGNVIDLAVGVIIGGAFTGIVNSLVNDIFMPFIGMIMGNIDFAGLKVVLKEATEAEAEVAIRYGNFIQAIVNFLIVAIVIFMTIKAINRLNRKKLEEAAAKAKAEAEAKAKADEEAKLEAAKPSAETVLLTEIRDLLKNK